MTTEFIEGLPAEARATLTARMVVARHARNDRIWNEGDLPDGVHLIDSGRVAVRSMTLDGDEATLAILGEGDIFGEMALLGPAQRRTASVVALEATQTRRVPPKDWTELRASFREIDDLVAQLLATYVTRLGERLTEALFVPAETRIVRQLLRVGEKYRSDDSAGATIRLTGQNLADLAGTSRPTVSSVLSSSAVRAVGVEVVRGRIIVADLDALADLESTLRQSNRSDEPWPDNSTG